MQITFRTSFFFLILVIILSEATFAAPPTQRALLIGINNYLNVEPLHGCLNDVEAMRTLLTTRYQFPKNNVRTLTDTGATRVNILAAFQQLIDSSNPGDIVVIHYSGHGSQITDHNAFNNQDETLIPYDYSRGSGVFPISDKQIANMLAQLCNRTQNVTVILDCCHAGGLTKALDMDKSIERKIAPDPREMPQTDKFRTLSGKDSTLKIDDSRYVLIAGCTADQSSYEISTQAQYHGAMSYYLTKELEHPGDQSWQKIVDEIGPLISISHNQTPMVTGLNKRSLVFGGLFTVKKSYLTIRTANDTILLDGGAVHGLSIGSLYDVYPPGEIDFVRQPLARVKVSKVNTSTSIATLVSGNIPTGVGRAVEVLHIYDRGELTIRFWGSWSGPMKPVQQTVLSTQGIQEEKFAPQITLYHRGDSIDLFFGNDSANVLERFGPASPAMTRKLDTALVRWLRWIHVAQISNPNPKIDFAVTLNETAKALDLTRADYTYKDGTLVDVTITNNSDIACYITVLDLEDQRAITAYTIRADGVGGFTLDPTRTTFEQLPARVSKTFTIKMELRDGRSSVKDILKVYATTKPLFFDYLEQSGLIIAPKPDNALAGAKDFVPADNVVQVLDEWNTVEKILLTTK